MKLPKRQLSSFLVFGPGGDTRTIALNRGQRRTLLRLIDAGQAGFDPINIPGVRWSAHVHRLRKLGVDIETIRRPAPNDPATRYGVYFLRSRVRAIRSCRSDGEGA